MKTLLLVIIIGTTAVVGNVVIKKINLPPPTPVAIEGNDPARGYDPARLLGIRRVKASVAKNPAELKALWYGSRD